MFAAIDAGSTLDTMILELTIDEDHLEKAR